MLTFEYSEFFIHTALIQNPQIKNSELSYIYNFLNKTIDTDLESKVFYELVDEIKRAVQFDVTASKIEMLHLLNTFNQEELFNTAHFFDIFLYQVPDPNMEVLEIILKCISIFESNSSLFISDKKFPLLSSINKTLDQSDKYLQEIYDLSEKIKLKQWRSTTLNQDSLQIAYMVFIMNIILEQDKNLQNEKCLDSFTIFLLPGLSDAQIRDILRTRKSLSQCPPVLCTLLFKNICPDITESNKQTLIEKIFTFMNHHYISVHNTVMKRCLDMLNLPQYIMNNLAMANLDNPESWNSSIKVIDFKESEQYDFTPGLANKNSPEGAEHHSMRFMANGKGYRMHVALNREHHDIDLNQQNQILIGSSSFYIKPNQKKMYHHISDLSLSALNISHQFNKKIILNDISFNIQDKEVMAVCGTSGSGKSTLLMILAGLLKSERGQILYNNSILKNSADFRNIFTYISQDDILYSESTVYESILEPLQLQMRASKNHLHKRVKEIISILGLRSYERVLVGDEDKKGISGGQRKRVNIGSSIAGDMKKVLLFDEPCSGLDPSNRQEIFKLLRAIAKRGHIVLVITHDIDMQILDFIDKILVLDEKGNQAFYGPANMLTRTFELSDPKNLYQKMEQVDEGFYSNLYKHSSLAGQIQSLIKKKCEFLQDTPVIEEQKVQQPGLFSSFKTFLKFDLIRKCRDRQYLLACLLQPLFIGLFIHFDFDGPTGNAFFSIVVSCLWIGSIIGVREINREWTVLKKNYRSGASLPAYYFSKVCGCVAFSFFQVILMATIICCFGGYLIEPFNFSYSAIVASLLLLTLFNVVLGLFLSSLFNSPLASVCVLPVVLIPLLIKGGLLYKHSDTHGIAELAMRFNPVRVTFESALISGDKLLSRNYFSTEDRSPEQAEAQLGSLNEYRDKVQLFHSDPNKYQKKYGTKKDTNRVLDLIFARQPASKGELLEPSLPANIHFPELLEYRKDLWLSNYILCDIEKIPGTSPYSFTHPDYFKKVEVTPANVFINDQSAQGLLGFYRQHRLDKGGVQSISCYSAADYLLIISFEIFLIMTATLFLLRYKLNRYISH